MRGGVRAGRWEKRSPGSTTRVLYCMGSKRKASRSAGTFCSPKQEEY